MVEAMGIGRAYALSTPSFYHQSYIKEIHRLCQIFARKGLKKVSVIGENSFLDKKNRVRIMIISDKE